MLFEVGSKLQVSSGGVLYIWLPPRLVFGAAGDGGGWLWRLEAVNIAKPTDNDENDVNFLNVTQTDLEGVNIDRICIYDADEINEMAGKEAYHFSLLERSDWDGVHVFFFF